MQRCPSAFTNEDFARTLDSFLEILKGEGDYNQVVKGEAFAKFQEDLADPRKKSPSTILLRY